MKALCAGVVGVSLAVSVGAQAQATRFTSQPIAVLGSTAVDAEAINAAGVIVGTVETQGRTGFVLNGSALSLLPNAYPTSVNTAGAVTGFTGNGGFLWQKGAFKPGVDFPLAFEGNVLPRPLLNRRGELAYSTFVSNNLLAYAGTPTKPQLQKHLSETYTLIDSISDDGTLAGVEYATLNGSQMLVVFSGKNGLFDMLITPGNSPNSAFVNNAGLMAVGTASQGYTYDPVHSAFTAIPTPSGVYGVTIQALNNAGRAAGIYADNNGDGMQHVFLFNGQSVSPVAGFPATDKVHVALNDRGVMVISDTPANSATSASFLVRCTGTGC
jgi:hypothetical protein